MHIISFNSRGSSVLHSGQRTNHKAELHDYCLLSNLYGAVEFEYMADRFQNHQIKALFTVPGSGLRNPRQFEAHFHAIHSKGKPGSWKRGTSTSLSGTADDASSETTIAMGILAKLCGKAYCPTGEGKKRRKYLMKLAKIDETHWIPMKGELSTYEKAMLMLPLLRRKFTPPGLFRDTLMATKDAQLIEMPMRGKPHLWEGRLCDGHVVGGNLCGRLLMYVRDTLESTVDAEDDQRALTQLVAEATAGSAQKRTPPTPARGSVTCPAHRATTPPRAAV